MKAIKAKLLGQKQTLFSAVQKPSNIDEVRALIDAGAEVNRTDNAGKTPLFYAVQQSNNEEIVHALIGAGAEVNKTYEYGQTVLFYAVEQSNNGNVVRALVDAGADVNETDNAGKTPLFYAVKQSNNEEIVRVLIGAGAEVNKTYEYGKTVLFYAVKQSNNEEIVRTLIGAGADVNETDIFDKTVLFYAVEQSNNEEIVRTLIGAGAEVNKTYEYGQTVLFYAVQHSNNEEIVRILIAAGADVNKTANNGKSAVFYAIQQCMKTKVPPTFSSRHRGFLRYERQSNNGNMVRALIDAGADVNQTDNDGKTALFVAVRQGNEYVVRELIAAGADVNKTDNNGQSAVFYAVQQCMKCIKTKKARTFSSRHHGSLRYERQSNNGNVVRALIDAGADVNQTDNDGKTALFVAVQQGNEYVVRVMIAAGADVNKTDNNGQSAVFYAVQQCMKCIKTKVHPTFSSRHYGSLRYERQSNNGNVVRALIDTGADVNQTDNDGKTALFVAVQQGNEEIVRVLIAAGADVNRTDNNGKSAVLYAVQQCMKTKVPPTFSNRHRRFLRYETQRKKEKVVGALLDAGADVNKTDNNGRTALFYAVQQSNNGNVVRALIGAGADVNKTYEYGKTALFYAVQQSNNGNVVRALIGAGADVNKTYEDDKTALFYAVQQSNNENVVRALIDAGADVNKTYEYGKTALFYALQRGNNGNVVLALIGAGADVNKTYECDKTALFYALQQSSKEYVVRALIDAGADVNKTDNHGQTVLFYAVQGSNNKNVVRTLIETASASLSNKDCYGRTPLFYACDDSTTFDYLLCKLKPKCFQWKDNYNVSIVTFVIENVVKKYSYSFQMNDAYKHLYLFIKHGVKKETIVKTLLNLMFSKIPLVTVFDKVSTFSTVMQLATLCKKFLDFRISADYKKLTKIVGMLESDREKDIMEVFQLLVGLGADPNSADSDGNTALHHVTRLSLYSVRRDIVMNMCSRLEEYGIPVSIKNHEGQTPLLFCLSEGVTTNSGENLSALKIMMEVSKFLMERGSSLEGTSRSGECVCHLMMKLFQKALKIPDPKLRGDMLQETAILWEIFTVRTQLKGNLVIKPDGNLNTPAHLWASLQLSSAQGYTVNITTGHTFETLSKEILQKFVKLGAKLNPRNNMEETPLHLCRTWTAVKLLLENGAKPKDMDSSGRSALLTAANRALAENTDHLYPDVKEDPNAFWKTAIKKGLDPWAVDKHGDSVLSILVQSGNFTLSKALVDVACEENYAGSESIFVSLLNAICKDTSTSNHWKSVLVQDLLKSRASSTIPGTPLHFSCRNFIAQFGEGVAQGFESIDHDELGTDDHMKNSEGQNSVHYEIADLLICNGADPESVDSSGKSCLDIAETCPALKDLLTKPIDINTIKVVIPWTSLSKKYEGRLAKVARRQEMEEVDSFWYHKDYIGSGSFGLVFAGINEKDGREVAIKRVETLRMNRPEDKREITNLTKLANCEQVVRYLHFIEKGAFSFVVLELMEGNLDDYFKDCFNASKDVELCKDVVLGAKYLHEQNIIHRDLKPTNVLYKTHPKLCLKIADFGLSQCIDIYGKTTVYGTNVGTRCWIGPEALKSGKHTKSSDVFSCGLLLHYILSRQKHPFSPVHCAGKTEFQVALETETNVVNGKMEGFDDSFSPEATDLVKKMLADETNIDKRTAKEALQHPLFWSKEKKIDVLNAVGNQPEFECPRAKRTHPLTAVETDLENSFGAIVIHGKWNDRGYVNMPAIYTEMTPPRRRNYVTSSAVELVRFIRNAYSHVSEDTRTEPFKKMLLQDFVFLKYFPQLVLEVYKAVTTQGWDQTREEVKYAINK